MKLSEILRAGKKRIETEGWAQGDEAVIFQRKGCRAATAIDGPGCIDAIDFFARINVPADMGVGNWNDAPELTVEDVYAAYDKAIAAAEAQEQAQ
jgi:hypothetical protein